MKRSAPLFVFGPDAADPDFIDAWQLAPAFMILLELEVAPVMTGKPAEELRAR
jgi:hypothetical protein